MNIKLLNKSGIILVKSNNCLDLYLCKLLNLEYSHIGFYFMNNGIYKTFLLYNFELKNYEIKEQELILSDIVKLDYRSIKSEYISEFIDKLNFIFETYNNIKLNNPILILKSILNKNLKSYEIFNNIIKLLDNNFEKSLSNNYNLLGSNKFNDILSLDIINTKIDKLNPTNIELLNILLTNNIQYDLKLLSQDFSLVSLLINSYQNKTLDAFNFNKIYKLYAYNNKDDAPSLTISNDLLILNKDTISKNINNIKILIYDIINDINNNNIPSLRLDKLIKYTNILSQEIDTEHKDININIDIKKSLYCLLLFNDNSLKDIPLQLKNNQKIIVPMNEFNYSNYKKEELEEMLTILDIYSNNDPKLDQIKSLIYKELSKKNISF